MSNQNHDLEDLISDLAHINIEFTQKIRKGTSDPDDFLKLHEIERLWKELRLNTDKIYSDHVMTLMKEIDETELIRKKKENTEKEE